MWNDTDIPLAYFISFRAHGTWLHGDPRGSTVRFNNRFGTPHIPGNDTRLMYNRKKMIGEPVKLDAARRHSIGTAILETCSIRSWILPAFNIRTNHVHSVAANSGTKGELILNALKANATRQMRKDDVWMSDRSRWADKAASDDSGMKGASQMR